MVSTDMIDILLAKDNQQEAKEVIDFFQTLDKEEKRDFSMFIQGAKFIKNQEIKRNLED